MAKKAKASKNLRDEQKDYPYYVAVYDITYEKWLCIDKWCHDNGFFYTTDYIDWDGIMDTHWTFKHSEDAALFKLTWL